MAVDKLVDSAQLDADLTSVANAIRTKGGTSADLAFPAGFVSAVAAIPTGGGTPAYESGSFVATTSDTLTIPVTKLHSILEIWHPDFAWNMVLSNYSFGGYNVLYRCAISPDDVSFTKLRGTILYGMTNSTGATLVGGVERGSTYGGTSNYITFTQSSIELRRMRIGGGGNRSFVDGATYNWRAW